MYACQYHNKTHFIIEKGNSQFDKGERIKSIQKILKKGRLIRRFDLGKRNHDIRLHQADESASIQQTTPFRNRN